MEEIHGEIEGQQISENDSFRITEHSENHYTVMKNHILTEVFLDSAGLLSDGNALDGVEVKVLTKRERIINEHFAKSQANGATGSGTKGMILRAPMPGMVR